MNDFWARRGQFSQVVLSKIVALFNYFITNRPVEKNILRVLVI